MPSKRKPRPDHIAVFWADEVRVGSRWKVPVKCAECLEPRMLWSRSVADQITQGSFTGRCSKHQEPHEWTVRAERPKHPAIDWTPVKVARKRMVSVTCPKCSTSRWAYPGQLAARIREGRFTGDCLPCSPNARKREWVTLSPGRKLDPIKGYVRSQLAGVAPEDRWLWDAMRGGRTYVLEHRMAMARVLGRPLTINELVDHRDGIKTNNDPSNLRLYRRGKNDDGSGCGYGTYYDEWQRAEAEVRRLRATLAAA